MLSTPSRPTPLPCSAPALACGHVHEIHAGAQDWAAALAFALCGLGSGRKGALVVVRKQRGAARAMRLYGGGLIALGVDPARLLIVETGDDRDLLRAGLDAARCPALAAVVLETWGAMPAYDLTASRRLVLAGERSGVGIAVLRGDAPPRASAAHTRWSIRAAPSRPLPARAPGHPAIMAELQRQRGGAAGIDWRLEWDGTDGDFRATQPDETVVAPPPSGAVVPFPALRAG